MTAHTSVGKQKPPRSRPQNSCAGFADGLKIMAPGIRRAERGGRVFFGGRQAGSSGIRRIQYVREDSPTYERTNQEKGKEDKSVVRWRCAWRSGIEASAKVVEERRCQVSKCTHRLGVSERMPLKFPGSIDHGSAHMEDVWNIPLHRLRAATSRVSLAY